MPSNSQQYVFPLVVSAAGLLIRETNVTTESVACDGKFRVLMLLVITAQTMPTLQ
jgi:hypothetical protein